MNTSAAVSTVWQQQGVWSETASRLKREIARHRSILLSLVISTAVLETIAANLLVVMGSQTLASRIFAGAGAILIAAAAYLQSRAQAEQTVSRWTRARSASEALKEQGFRYLTGTGSYSGADREAVLIKTAAGIVQKVRDLEVVAAMVEPTPHALPAIGDLGDYVRLRVVRQIDEFYRPRALALARRRRAWRRAQSALLFLGVILGALVAMWPISGLAGWIAVLTTVSAAFGAHIEASRFDHLVLAYRATASRLEALRDEWCDTLSKRSLTPADQAEFVNRCEDAISVENQAWMAGWTRND